MWKHASFSHLQLHFVLLSLSIWKEKPFWFCSNRLLSSSSMFCHGRPTWSPHLQLLAGLSEPLRSDCTECVAIPNSAGTVGAGALSVAWLWICFVAVGTIILYLYFILFLFLFKWIFKNLNRLAASCFHAHLSCQNLHDLLHYVTFAPLCFQKLSTVFSHHTWGSGS